MDKKVLFSVFTKNELKALIIEAFNEAPSEPTLATSKGEMIRLKDWAKLRGVTYQTAWNYVKANKIKAERIGSMWYVVSDNKKG